MTKHTPGPWTIDKFDTVTTFPRQVWDEEHEVVVCSVHQRFDDNIGEVARVNAHLIAAAPDLLAVAEDAYQTASNMGLSDKMLSWGAAIAKARGQG